MSSSVTHFGGSIGPGFAKSGRLSRRPDGKHILGTIVFVERLVRFDLARLNGQNLMSDLEIAKVLGKSVRRLKYMRGTIPYMKKRMEFLTGINTDTAEQVAQASSLHRQQLKMMLPAALRIIYDTAQRPITPTTTLAERKFQVEVAKDILDREGSLPRISRTESHVKMEHDFGDLDGVSRDVLDSIDTPIQAADPSSSKAITDAIAVSKDFSNTATLSAQEMEASLASLEAMPVSGEVQ